MKQAAQGFLLLLSPEDEPYISRLSPFLKGIPHRIYTKEIISLAQFTEPCRKAGIKHIITSRQDVLKKLLPQGREKGAKIDNYAGSIVPYGAQGEFEFLIIAPLKQLVSKPFGEFLTRRYISKFANPSAWRKSSQFQWKLVQDTSTFQEALSFLAGCDLIGVDIETARWNTSITCAGYCGIRLDTNESFAYVIPFQSMQQVNWIRKLNSLEVPKVLQGGRYDIAYFARFNSPLCAYYYDTSAMLHAWYSELPKDLANVSALLTRDSMYWKDLADTNDKMEYYKYNALDTWATVESAVSWLQEAPKWALENYKTKFPLIPVSHMCELRGIKRDMEKLNEAARAAEEIQNKLLLSMQKAAGHANFNPSSPKQVLALLHILGYKKAESSDEATLVEAATTHPLLEYFVAKILEYRGERKLSSTYLKTGEDAAEFHGRILFSLNPHGTDTGRNSSKEHHFWCGLNVQNIPSDSIVKDTLIADDGFELWEADYAQAEDRGVAYNSGDANLLDIFNRDVDSHSYKAAMFFGIPYEEIYEERSRKVLRKDIRQLGKRINHGANYNMGAGVLLLTMGSKAVREAQAMLKLNPALPLLKVCEHLLFLYERAFPTVKSRYYNSIKSQIAKTNKLVGATGWTRWCFGDPLKSKQALNAYVAHVTQSLNAMILDKAFVRVFKALAFKPEFKLVTQIHDSILFQTKLGHEYLASEVKELMTFPVKVTDSFGTTRDMVVPVDIKKLGRTWRGNE